MMPPKNTSATDARISAVRTLAMRRVSLSIPCRVISGFTSYPALRDVWRGFEGVIGQGRRQRPFERIRAFPGSGGRRLAVADAVQHDVQEQHLRKAEAECAHGRHLVEVSKLRRVIRNAA